MLLLSFAFSPLLSWRGRGKRNKRFRPPTNTARGLRCYHWGAASKHPPKFACQNTTATPPTPPPCTTSCLQPSSPRGSSFLHREGTSIRRSRGGITNAARFPALCCVRGNQRHMPARARACRDSGSLSSPTPSRVLKGKPNTHVALGCAHTRTAHSTGARNLLPAQRKGSRLWKAFQFAA